MGEARPARAGRAGRSDGNDARDDKLDRSSRGELRCEGLSRVPLIGVVDYPDHDGEFQYRFCRQPCGGILCILMNPRLTQMPYRLPRIGSLGITMRQTPRQDPIHSTYPRPILLSR